MSTEIATSYRRDIRVRTPRSRVRDAALSIAARFPRTTDALAIPRVHFLYLHFVFDDEVLGFERLIDRLRAADQRFVSYRDAIDRVRNGDIDAPMVSFSFDDGVSNTMRAAEILTHNGISACFFINSGLTHTDRSRRVIKVTQQSHSRRPLEFISWDDAERLIQMGHEIGGHTRTHADLASIGGQQLRDEIGGDRELLLRRLGRADHFAWPFGAAKYFSATARDVVFEAGYRSCASAIRGAHTATAPDHRFCVRRDCVVAAEPVSRNLYFVRRSARRAADQPALMNRWPEFDAAVANTPDG